MPRILIRALFLTLIAAFFSMTAAQSGDNCAGLLPPRLFPGGQGRVLPPTPNNLRQQPDATSPVVTRLPSESVFEILSDQPVCADGYRWWRVRFTVFEGWTAEGDTDSYWLAPAPTNGREIIKGSSVFRLELLETLGFGYIANLRWDDDSLILNTTTGTWRYYPLQPHQLPEEVDNLPHLTARINGSAVQVIDSITGAIYSTLEHPSRVVRVFFSDDFEYVVTQLQDNTFRLWRSQTGEIVGDLPGFGFFTSDNRFIGYRSGSAGSDDPESRTLHLLDAATLTEFKAFTFPDSEAAAQHVRDIEISPDGRLLVLAQGCAICGSDLLIEAWDMVTGEPIAIPVDYGFAEWDLAFNEDGSRLAGGSVYGEVRVWDTRTWESQVLTPGNGRIDYVEFSPDSSTLCYGGSYSPTFAWDISSRRMPVLVADGDCSFTAAIDNKLPYTVSYNPVENSLDVYQMGTWLWGTHDPQGYRFTFSPDGTLLVVSGYTPRVLDAATGREIAVFNEQDASSEAVFSPDGRWLVLSPYNDGWTVSTYPYIIIWDTRTHETNQRLNLILPGMDESYWTGIFDSVFSPDGDLLVTTSSGRVYVWNTNTWLLVAQLDDYMTSEQYGENVNAAAFSPDGTLLAVGGGSSFEAYSSQSVVRVYAIGQD